VLDLVHPSLYCIVYGRTIAREEFPEATYLPMPSIDYTTYLASDPRFNIVDHTGWRAIQPHRDRLHAASELNSEFVSEKFSWLPTDFAISSDGSSAKALSYINNLHPDQHRDMYPVIEQLVARFVPLWERVLAESVAGYVLPSRTQDGYWRERTREDAYYEALEDGEGREDHYAGEGELRPPRLIKPFKSHTLPPVVSLGGRPLQVIVKLASIHLVSCSR
jgi:hypothetical protein